MILTVTLNPAIDKTVFADRLVFEDRAYIVSRTESAGGRGLNASAVLHAWGADTLAIVPSGGDSGQRFQADLARLGFPYEIVPIQASIRSNLIITDRGGLTVKLNEPGAALSDQELETLATTVRKHLPGAAWLLLCGSLPPGVPSSFYRRLIAEARAHGVKTLLDTDGDVLQDGLIEAPAVVTPNRQEAATLLNRSLITRQHFRAAAQRIREMGAESVILSLGSRGAIGAVDGDLFEAIPPRVDAVCPIGAGDAMNAAFAWAMTQKHDFADAVKWAVAAGTASATLPGLQFASLDQARELYRFIDLKG